MKAVGIRELKNHLSEYIRLVRAGEEVLVTDRGEVVAELRSPSRLAPKEMSDTGLEELARKGLVTLGAPNDPEAYPAMPSILSPGEISRLLDEERGER